MTNCPVCGAARQLRIYQDGTAGGEWTRCDACSFSGNMIQLAAAVWKLDTPATLRKLVDSQIGLSEAVLSPSVIRDYIKDHVKYPQRVAAFWQDAQACHVKCDSPELSMLQGRYSVGRWSEDWPRKGGQFIGSSTRSKLMELVMPHTVAKSDARVAASGSKGGKRSGTSCVSHLMPGSQWQDMLVMPHYDVPGRICGFMLIGRDGDPSRDFFYRHLANFGCGNESGLAMLDSLMLPPLPRLGHTGFIFTDHEFAIRLQMRYMKDHFRPLPIAVAYKDENYETADVWNWLGHEDLVCWGNDNAVAAILHAKRANAKVSLIDVSGKEIAKDMRHRGPEEWLDQMKWSAQPWATALRQLLRDMPKAEIESILLTDMELQGRDLAEFIKGCDPELRERLEYIERNRSHGARVRFENRWLFEKNDGWYVERGNDRICNAIIRVEQVLTTADHRSYHRGTIKFHGHVYPFTARADVVEKGLLKWAHDYLRDELQVGVLEYYPSWNTKSFQLAIAFHTPEFIHGVEVVGWDERNRQFNFPQFSICRNGEVTDKYACLFDNERVPAKDIPKPGNFPRKHMESLSDVNDETALFWATAAAVGSNLLAPALRRKPVGLLLDGDGGQSVGAAAASRLGCVSVPAAKGHAPLAGICSQVNQYLWPTILCDVNKCGEWLDSPEAQNIIVALPWAANRVLASRGGWNMIHCDRKLGSMQLSQHAAPYVLPNYLRDIYQRNLLLADDCDDLIINVLDDMAEWFYSVGGNSDAVQAAKSVLVTPATGPPASHFLHLIFRLHRDGKLDYTRASHDDAKQRQHAIVSSETRDVPVIWVSQNMLSDAVHKAGGLRPDLLLITRSLEELGVLVGESPYKDEQGWLVPEPWFNQELTNWRSKCQAT